jgi:predicted membrane protein (TIGR00267 family)
VTDGPLARLRSLSVGAISRRYFVSNGFDGVLTSIGIAVGAYLSGISDGRTVVAISVGAAIGLGTSGVWSVWEIERIERRVELLRTERAMLRDLDGTEVHQAGRRLRVVNAALSGLGPVLGVVLPTLPFLFEGTYLTLYEATLLAVAVGSTLLFVFGVYLSRRSDQRWFVAGLRMGLAGVVVALLNLVLPG